MKVIIKDCESCTVNINPYVVPVSEMLDLYHYIFNESYEVSNEKKS